MQKKWNFSIRSSFLLSLIIYGCLTKSDPEDKSDSFCDIINKGDDLYAYWMKEESHDSLLMVVESCEQTPEVISARLNLLSLLGRNEEAIRLIATLKNSDFKNPFDSLSSLNYFKAELSMDSAVKKELYSQTLKYISAYLEKQPTDSLALFNYCETALNILSEHELYQKIDSMAKQNNFNPVYEFVISSYLENYLDRYKKDMAEYREAKVI